MQINFPTTKILLSEYQSNKFKLRMTIYSAFLLSMNSLAKWVKNNFMRHFSKKLIIDIFAEKNLFWPEFFFCFGWKRKTYA
jgi:hypothetical protein